MTAEWTAVTSWKVTKRWCRAAGFATLRDRYKLSGDKSGTPSVELIGSSRLVIGALN
jgi:hypothetical protein